jgi:predicted nuclease with TOPRIM domain
MSMVEDVRQVIQDFLAPELRAMSVRFDALEKIMEARFKEMDSRFEEMDSRFKEIDSRFKEIDSRFKEIDSRFNQADERFNSRFNEVVLRIQTLQETVDRNDTAQKQLITKLTQDFEFDKRLTEIERQLRHNQTTAA